MQRRNFMFKSAAALAVGCLTLAGCTTTSNQGAQKTAGNVDELKLTRFAGQICSQRLNVI